jgi:hypothetical protein
VTRNCRYEEISPPPHRNHLEETYSSRNIGDSRGDATIGLDLEAPNSDRKKRHVYYLLKAIEKIKADRDA